MRSRIRFPRYTLRVRAREAEVTYAPSPEDQAAAFRRLWEDCQHRFGAPHCPWTGREQVIARRLLATWGLDKLRTSAEQFWQRMAGPIFEGEESQHLVIFAAAMRTLGQEEWVPTQNPRRPRL